jgi:hypothetical protein
MALSAFRDEYRNNQWTNPGLHPILLTLSIVIVEKEDIGTIGRHHKLMKEHKHYRSDVVFPSDLSDLLPPKEDRWWELLGKLKFNCSSPCHSYNYKLGTAEESRKRQRSSEVTPPSLPVPPLPPAILVHNFSSSHSRGRHAEHMEEDEVDELLEDGMDVDESFAVSNCAFIFLFLLNLLEVPSAPWKVSHQGACGDDFCHFWRTQRRCWGR